MRRLKLYFKMACQNLTANRRFYFPYSLCCIGLTAMFYIMNFLAYDKMIDTMRGSVYVRTTMVLGVAVLGIFSVFLLGYANSFIMKRRKRELGLYNILGMEKRHITLLMLTESVILSLGNLLIGICAGLLLSKLTILLLAFILRNEVPMGFSVSWKAIQVTVGVYGGILLLCFLGNVRAVRKASPIELLHSANAGEKEPKGRPLLAVLGLALLSGGYAIAILTVNPVQALLKFFVAVLLVIFGTYALFTAGSISALKLLRRNKRFYYRPGPFTAVSGLLYRMKQNAVGMANICILSTMVLVTISSTVSLYAGMDGIIKNQYPYELEAQMVILQQDAETDLMESPEQDKLVQTLKNSAESVIPVTGVKQYKELDFTVTSRGNGIYTIDTANYYDLNNISTLQVLTLSDYNRLTGENKELKSDEILVYKSLEKEYPDLTIGEKKYTVKEYLNSFPLSNWEMLETMNNGVQIVVADDDALREIYQMQYTVYDKRASRVFYTVGLDLDGTANQKLEAYENALTVRQAEQLSFSLQSRQDGIDELYSFNGSFLFLGIFLGMIFMMAAVLIIYYKQVSEGYSDRERFIIMQKVGMDRKTVKRSISTQVLLVFFLPLLTAGVHILFAFPMISRLLQLFALNNIQLFACCTLITFLVFTCIYIAVYLLTARTYYKIVGENTGLL